MMQKLKLVLVVILSLLLLALPQTSNAQQSPSGSGLSISPTINQLTIKPGESNHVTIALKNITVDDVVAKGSVNDFKSNDITGEPQIITNSNVKLPNSIKGFVANIDDVPLAKG